jgi:hypothetical protein
MRNSSKSCATYTLSKLKYGIYRTMATITDVSSSPPHATSVRERMTIRIRYRILNARLAAGAVSGGGADQAYDGW